MISVTVNRRTYQHDVAPRMLLVHYLREQLNLTGTHIGCDTSQCGACVVLLNGVSVKACTVLAVQANSAAITTIEGISTNGQLHPLQEGFWENHGLQCGFCTPGMIMSAYDLLQRSPNPSEDEISHGLEGNLCRCTGYQNIVKAVQYAAAKASGRELGQDPSARTDGDSPGKEYIEAVMSNEHGPRSPETTAGSDEAPVAG